MNSAPMRKRPASSAGRSNVSSDPNMSVRHYTFCDRLFEIGTLLAARGADLRQPRQVFLGLGDIADLDIKLAHIFERALVVGIEIERLLVVSEGVLHVARLAQAVAQE